MSLITVERKVLEKNDVTAAANRARLEANGVYTINLVSSPGAGKTTLLERTIERLRDRLAIGVIEGDVHTDLDAQRVARFGVPVVQIVTNGGCHLEAKLVADALDRLDLAALKLDLLVIENVGNLVCPANYDLGESMKVAVLSTTEGDDKPLKYPTMFRNAAALVINKIDLLPYVSADVQTMTKHAHLTNPDLTIFETSATTGAGLPAWCDWLAARVSAVHA
jgi:hydrogenase nickel incorporation protein HypB